MVTGPIGRQGVINKLVSIPLLEGLVVEGGLKQEFPRMHVNSGIDRWVSQRQSGNRLVARLNLIVQSHRPQKLP